MLFGYSGDDAVGRTFGSLFAQADFDDVQTSALGAAETAERWEMEGWRLHKDGQQFWTHTSLTPLRDGAGSLAGYGVIASDVSDKKEAHEAGLSSERNYRLLVEGSLTMPYSCSRPKA